LALSCFIAGERLGMIAFCVTLGELEAGQLFLLQRLGEKVGDSVSPSALASATVP